MAHGDPAFQHEGIDVVPAVTRSARISALRISVARGDDDALELRRRSFRGVIDRHGGSLYVRRPRPLARHP
jgi:hypothetical protein